MGPICNLYCDDHDDNDNINNNNLVIVSPATSSSRLLTRDRVPAPAEFATVPMRGQRIPDPGEPVRHHCGHEPRDQLDGLLSRTGRPRADIRVDQLAAVGAAQHVLRRLPAGQLSGVRARVPIRQQDATGVQHDRLVFADHHQPTGGIRVWCPRPGGRPVRTGPIVGVHVPHGARHHVQVGAAARARPVGRVHQQWNTAGHHDHDGRFWCAVQQLDGLAERLLPERRLRVGVDGHLATAGLRVAVHAPVRQPGRDGLHPEVARQHRQPR